MSGNLWMFSDMLDDEDIEMQKHDFITLRRAFKLRFMFLMLAHPTTRSSLLNSLTFLMTVIQDKTEKSQVKMPT